MWNLSIDVMLFDHFRGHFAIMDQNVAISTGFIRVSATRLWHLRNLVFVCFIRLFDMAECHVEFIYKRNAFDRLRGHFAILLQTSPISTGLIRFSALVFSMCVLPMKPNVICDSGGARNAILTTF